MDFNKIFAGFLAGGAKAAAGEAIKAKGQKCGIHDCKNYSVGLSCFECRKFLCGDHLYFKPSIKEWKPTCICPGCITDLHPEIFANDNDEAY